MTGDFVRSPFGAFPLAVYDLSLWNRFLLQMLVPDAIRLPLAPGETRDDILRRLPADFAGTFAFHVNLTDASRSPPDRAELVAALHARGVRTLNGGIADISKRFVQATCRGAGLMTTSAPREGDAAEMLIVKTNRNYGGKPETHVPDAVRSILTFSEHAIHDGGDHGYLVAPRREVPPAAWDDPDYVVERYIENERRLFYRAYIFCDRIAISEGTHDVFVKAIRHAQRERLLLLTVTNGAADGAVPDDLAALVEAVIGFSDRARLDFGCLDVMRDGEGRFYIVDVNTTASWGPETEYRILRHLSPHADLAVDAAAAS